MARAAASRALARLLALALAALLALVGSARADECGASPPPGALARLSRRPGHEGDPRPPSGSSSPRSRGGPPAGPRASGPAGRSASGRAARPAPAPSTRPEEECREEMPAWKQP